VSFGRPAKELELAIKHGILDSIATLRLQIYMVIFIFRFKETT
jgi:hypothetical protein